MTRQPTPRYPGRTYNYRWMIDGGVVRRVAPAEIRAYRGGPRIVLLAYGALASPTNILARLGDLAEGVTCLPGEMVGAARCWTAGGPAARGVPPWTLVAETSDLIEHVHVLLLPVAAIPILDLVEGAPRFYKPVRLLDAQVEIPRFGTWRQPITYLGMAPHRSPMADLETGKPILVRDWPNGPPPHPTTPAHPERTVTHTDLRADNRTGSIETALFGSALGEQR